MSPSPIAQITRLLGSDVAEKQIAAAIVLGELRARDAAAIEGLIALARSGVPVLQRHALVALAAIASPRGLQVAVDLLGSRDEAVRAGATAAVLALGDRAVPVIRQRFAAAASAERRPYEQVLARLGGSGALDVLMSGLAADDLEAARTAVLPLRQVIKDTDARTRHSYRAQALRHLKETKAPAARLVALKVLGFIGDPATLPVLLRYGSSAKQPEAIRQEALIAARLAAGKAGAAKLAGPLLAIAESAPTTVAVAALYTLAGVPLPPATTPRLARLAAHPDAERALLAIELVGQQPGAAAALAHLLLETGERARAEAAAKALGGRTDAPKALADALVLSPDHERAQMIAALLRPHAKNVPAGSLRAVLDRALAHLERNDPRYEPLLSLARAADPAATAERLRALATRHRKASKVDQALRVLRVLGRGADASPDDGYALASLELTAGRKDEALVILHQLLARGFDVGAAMRKDRSLTPEQLYLVGFRFVEERHELGEELLTAVVDKAGRSKIGKMARAKLKSSGLGAD